MIHNSLSFSPKSGFSNDEIFFNRISSVFFFLRRFGAITAMCTLLPHAHDITWSHCRPYFAAVSLYRIVIYSIDAFHIAAKCIAAYVHKGQPCVPFYFYFYLVCRTSHIPGELIISVFNFLPLVYTELCVLNTELLYKCFAGMSLV